MTFAHWLIPDSGPSGRIGFNDVSSVVHKKETGFSHSDYFEPEHADRIWSEVWQPFLRNPADGHTYRSAGDASKAPEKPWEPRRLRHITHAIKWILFALLLAAGLTLVACTVFGAYSLWGHIFC